MRLWRAALPALLAGCVLGIAPGGATPVAAQEAQALNPRPAAEMQTQGKVGDTYYRWTNGRAWLSLSDDSKVAMVAGIEQGLILSVRENWKAVPKPTQKVLVKTAGQLTVGGVTFDQMVLQIDDFYLMPGNINIPVVDAYLYAVMKLQKTPVDKLKDMVNRLRKTYPLPGAPKGKH
jgi:hypothetical protein